VKPIPYDLIAEAFSRTASAYDAFAGDHPHLSRMRSKVYAHLTRCVEAGARIMELNAGTGTDAAALAQLGYHVHATDIAPGMLQRLQNKVEKQALGDRVTYEQRSFLELEDVPGAPFDAVFSDLGGLNCVPDLSPIIQQLPKVLRPGGVVTWVLMPRVCPWEMAEVFRGQLRLAFRRFSPKGTFAHLEGIHFPVYYFPARQVIDGFGKDYQLLALEGLSVLVPTAESKNFARHHHKIYSFLCKLDDRLASRPPWNGWGDFYILSMRYQPGTT